MQPLENSLVFRGGCHCGQLTVAFASSLDAASIIPRACDCSFCQKHGAAYVSDPSGQLTIASRTLDALHRYQQGSNSAEFLICHRCGVLTAVIFEHDTRILGAVNARCLDGPTGFGSAVAASPQQMEPGERIARWSQLWIPNVGLVIAPS